MWRRKKREREGLFDDDWFEDFWSPWSRFRYDDWFNEISENFRRMRNQMNRLFEKAKKGELKPPEEGGPFVYGWSMRVGPDGIPHVEEFGNFRGLGLTGEKPTLPGGREPLVDVIESEDKIAITVELPGIEKKDIELTTTEETVTIKVDTPTRKYYKEIELPAAVENENAKASYQNGVLDIVFPKKTVKKRGQRIKID